MSEQRTGLSRLPWLPLLAWARLWTLTYPLSAPTVDEALLTMGRAPTVLLTALTLPFMARAQHHAERNRATMTAVVGRADPAAASLAAEMDRWRSEPAWRSLLRETLAWFTAISWAVTVTAVILSVAFTGNFLFEVHESPETPGYVSNYFKVAALSGMIPVAWFAASLAILRATRRWQSG